ncbi:MAG: hypothetical protein HY040_20135 [Planctomycetes bacterium]|nr:hypothetical protein [Planctomycetota bacterium]MBI3762844.1 hypothetical protein [Chloroflexota bacterium]
MSNLRLEELEPRQLLNGIGFSPSPSSPQNTAVAAFSARSAERATFNYSGDRAGPSAQGGSWGGDGGPIQSQGVDSSRSGVDQRGIDNRGVDPRGNDQRGIGPRAASPGAAAGISDRAGSLAGNAASAATTGSAPGSLSDRARLPAISGLSNLGGALVGAFDLQGPSARIPTLIGPDGVGTANLPDSGSIQTSPPPSVTAPTPTAPGGVGIEDRIAPPLQMAGMLSALSAGGLRALELAMRDFLHQVERVGQPLDDRDGTDLYPWIVAGAAAAAACEIARRQLRRPADVPVFPRRPEL